MIIIPEQSFSYYLFIKTRLCIFEMFRAVDRFDPIVHIGRCILITKLLINEGDLGRKEFEPEPLVALSVI